MRSWGIVWVVVLVVLAGCTGFGGPVYEFEVAPIDVPEFPEPPPDPDADPPPEPRPTLDPADRLAPGVSLDRVVYPENLIEAHTGVLANESFTVEYVEIRWRPDGTLLAYYHHIIRVDPVTDAHCALIVLDRHPDGEPATREVTERWVSGNQTLEAVTRPGAPVTEYRVVGANDTAYHPAPSLPVLSEEQPAEPLDPTHRDQLRNILRFGPIHYAGNTTNDVTRYQFEAPKDESWASGDLVGLRLTLDERGQIHGVDLRYELLPTDLGILINATLTFRDVGTTHPMVPDWHDRALDNDTSPADHHPGEPVGNLTLPC